jgi:hypothetical protein
MRRVFLEPTSVILQPVVPDSTSPRSAPGGRAWRPDAANLAANVAASLAAALRRVAARRAIHTVLLPVVVPTVALPAQAPQVQALQVQAPTSSALPLGADSGIGRMPTRTDAAGDTPTIASPPTSRSASPDTTRAGARAPARARAVVAVAHVAAGGVGLPLGVLDARLRTAGLPGAAAGAATLGSGAHVLLGRRLLLGASGHALLGHTREQAGWRTRVGGGYALGEIGVAAVRRPHLLLAATGGVGAARVTARVRPIAGGRFDSVVVAPRRGTELASHTALLHAGVLADHVVRGPGGPGAGTFRLGVRAGWVGGVGRSRWQADDASLAGGPALAPRGAYAQLAIGTPLGRRRDALLPALLPALPWVAR